MKLHKVKQNAILATSVVFAMTAVAGLAGCGSSNPSAKYASSKDAVPVGHVTPDSGPTMDASQLFTVDESDRFMRFTEGETNTYYLRPTLMLENVKYTMVESGLPSALGVSITRATDADHLGMIAITWTPTVGTLANEISRVYRFSLTLQPNSDTDPAELANLQKILLTQNYELSLQKSSKAPTIDSRDFSGLTFAKANGADYSFSVTVKDIGAGPDTQPSLMAEPDSTLTSAADAPVFNAAPAIVVDGAPIRLGNNLFKFNLIFRSSKVTLPAGASSAKADFLLKVNGGAAILSSDTVIEFNVAAGPAAPSAIATKAPTHDSGNDASAKPVASGKPQRSKPSKLKSPKPSTNPSVGGGK